MKRSEMLLELAKLLHAQAVKLDKENGTYTADPDFEGFKEAWLGDADDMLSRMEKLGVRGPHNNSMSKYLDLVDENGWEHEDESK